MKISADGAQLEIDRPLYYDHKGDGYVSPNGRFVVEQYRAEVGLLTRNVVVQGDDATLHEQFGAQMVFSTGLAPALDGAATSHLTVKLSNVETRRVGQGLKLGKYPIHFHMAGNVSGSYVRNCSVLSREAWGRQFFSSGWS